jgi:hypothetical protein
MAEKPKPTYDELVADVAALRARLGRAESDLAAVSRRGDVRDAEAALRAKRPKPRALDPKAASAFDRPWDGR